MAEKCADEGQDSAANEVDAQLPECSGDSVVNKDDSQPLECSVNSGANEDMADKPSMSLVEAVDQGNTKLLQQLIASGCNVNDQNGDGHTALYRACMLGAPDMVDILLKAGSDPHIKRDIFSPSCVVVTASEGHSECLKMLLDVLPNIDDFSEAFTRAVNHGYLECLRLLHEYKHNKEPNNLSHISSAACFSAARGHVVCLEYLLDAGRDDLKNFAHRALDWAITGGHLGSIQVLLRAGAAKLVPEGVDILDVAVKAKRPDILHLLLEAGVSTASPCAGQALVTACSFSCPAMVEMLLKFGAKPDKFTFLSYRILARNARAHAIEETVVEETKCGQQMNVFKNLMEYNIDKDDILKLTGLDASYILVLCLRHREYALVQRMYDMEFDANLEEALRLSVFHKAPSFVIRDIIDLNENPESEEFLCAFQRALAVGIVEGNVKALDTLLPIVCKHQYRDHHAIWHQVLLYLLKINMHFTHHAINRLDSHKKEIQELSVHVLRYGCLVLRKICTDRNQRSLEEWRTYVTLSRRINLSWLTNLLWISAYGLGELLRFPPIMNDNEYRKEILQRLPDVDTWPPSLQKICRYNIYRCLDYNVEQKIQLLPIPTALKEYLNVPELDVIHTE